MRRAAQTDRQRLSEHLRTEHGTTTVTAYGYDKLIAFHRGLHVVEAPGPGGHYHHDGDYGLRFSREADVSTITADVGAGGWPLVPSPTFPGERTLACPKCGSTAVSLIGGAFRGGPPSGWGPERYNTNRCNDCGYQERFPNIYHPDHPQFGKGGSSGQTVRVGKLRAAAVTTPDECPVCGFGLYSDDRRIGECPSCGYSWTGKPRASFRIALDGFSVGREDAARVYAHPRAREAVSLLEDEYAAVAEMGAADPVVAAIAADLGMDSVTVLTALIAVLDDEEADALFESISPTSSRTGAEADQLWTSVCVDCSEVFYDLTDRCPRCGSDNVEDIGYTKVEGSRRTAARSYTQVGASYPRSQIDAAIDSIVWRDIGGDWPAMPGLAIELAITEFRIPKVERAGISQKLVLGRFEVYGIEGHYTDGTARIYVLDEGNALTPVASELVATANRTAHRPKRAGRRVAVHVPQPGSFLLTEPTELSDDDLLAALAWWRNAYQEFAGGVGYVPGTPSFVRKDALRFIKALNNEVMRRGIGDFAEFGPLEARRKPDEIIRSESERRPPGRRTASFQGHDLVVEGVGDGWVWRVERNGNTVKSGVAPTDVLALRAAEEVTPRKYAFPISNQAAYRLITPGVGMRREVYTDESHAIAEAKRFGDRTYVIFEDFNERGMPSGTNLTVWTPGDQIAASKVAGADPEPTPQPEPNPEPAPAATASWHPSSWADHGYTLRTQAKVADVYRSGERWEWTVTSATTPELHDHGVETSLDAARTSAEASLSKGAPTTPARNPYTPSDNPFSQAREPADPIDEGPMDTPPPQEVSVQPEEVEGQPTTTRPRGTQPEQMGATR